MSALERRYGVGRVEELRPKLKLPLKGGTREASRLVRSIVIPAFNV